MSVKNTVNDSLILVESLRVIDLESESSQESLGVESESSLESHFWRLECDSSASL